MSPSTYATIKEALETNYSGRRQKYKKNNVSEGGMICRGQNVGIADCRAHQLVKLDRLNLTNTSKDTNAYINQNVVGFSNLWAAGDVFDYAIGITREGAPQTGDFARIITGGVATLFVNEIKDITHRYIGVEDPSRVVTSDEPSPIKIIYIAADIANGDTDVHVKVMLSQGGGGSGGVAIPLRMTKDGGSQGTGSDMPTFTYLVENWLTGDFYYINEDPTAVPHQWVRHIGQMTEATFGWGFYDSTNNDVLTITWINEQMIAAICEEEQPPGGPDSPDSGGGTGGGTGGGDTGDGGGGLP
jgi:hypothetical protein